jgi:O-antigen/teichoic acid export membrane protein
MIGPRRRIGAAVGLWGSAAIGALSTVVAFRLLGLEGFGVFATAVAAAGLVQTLLDLTAEEALTKFGFKYLLAGEPGRVRRLFRVALLLKLGGGLAGGAVLAAVAPFAGALFGGDSLTTCFLIAAVLPLLQAPDSVMATSLLLHGRYDLRGVLQTVTMLVRLGGLAAGAVHGPAWAVGGLVAGQVVGMAILAGAGITAIRRLPAGPLLPLGTDRGPIRRFVVRSTVATGVISLRTSLFPLLLGTVASTTQVGLLRVALAPQTGFTTLSSPIRLIMLTEQTQQWERREFRRVIVGVRRYMLATLALVVVVAPVLYVAMPELIRVVFGDEGEAAVGAARIALFASALGFVFGWTKSFPVTIGRPGLRIVAHVIEAAVLLPLAIVLGSRSGVEGAAWALLLATAAFAAFWLQAFLRIGRDPRFRPQAVQQAPIS